MSKTGALLLAVLGVRHYGWHLVPVEHQADVWNACGALALLACYGLIAWRCWRADVAILAAVLGAHEVAVVAGSIAYIIAPWVVPMGHAQLSAWAGFDLAKVGGLLVLLAVVKLVAGIPVKVDR